MRRTMLHTFLGYLFLVGNQGIGRIKQYCNLQLLDGKSKVCEGNFPPVQYVPGDINLIFSVPHNGALKPIEIDDRENGCTLNGICRYGDQYSSLQNCRKESEACSIGTVADAYTQQIARWTQKEFEKLTGKKPHLVVSNLYRAKMDPNRPIEDAAQGNYLAEGAFNDYHETIEEAKETFGNAPGLLIDFHGQKHKRGIMEIGYMVRKDELRESDFGNSQQSISSLVKRKNAKIEDFLFGSQSLGAYFNSAGYDAVPSPDVKAPRSKDAYFRGGYSIDRHGSYRSGNVDGIQLEFPQQLRMDREKRKNLSKDLAKILAKFYLKNYEDTFVILEDL